MTISVRETLLAHTRHHRYRWTLKTVMAENVHAITGDEIQFHIHGHDTITDLCFFHCIYFDRATALEDFADLCPEAMAPA